MNSQKSKRYQRFVFFIALSEFLRTQYWESMAICSRSNDNAWYARKLTKIHNIISSRVVDKEMRNIWTDLLVYGKVRRIPSAAGLAVGLRLLFLEDNCRRLLYHTDSTDKIPDEDLWKTTYNLLTTGNFKTINSLLIAITTKAWKYLAPDWIKTKMKLDDSILLYPSEVLPDEYTDILSKISVKVEEIMYNNDLHHLHKSDLLQNLYKEYL